MSFEFALRHTTSILEKKPPRDVDPAGSAVLISISDEIYLVTAAHLLNLETWALLTMPGSDNSMINLQGRLITTMLKRDDGKKMDFSVLQFDRNMHKYLVDFYGLVSLDEILLNHKTEEKDIILITGYPYRKTKKVGKDEYDAVPYKFTTYPKPDAIYKKNDLDSDCYVLSEYRKRVANEKGEKVFAPELEGISGSGTWLKTSDSTKLIGISTEHIKDKSIIISIKIDIIIHVINEYFKLNLDLKLENACNVGTVTEIKLPSEI